MLLSDLESAGVDEATLEAEITRTVDALSHAKECVGVDEILLPEHHPIVFARRREQIKMQQTCRHGADLRHIEVGGHTRAHVPEDVGNCPRSKPVACGFS